MTLKVFFSARARNHLNKIEQYLAKRFSARNAEIYIERLSSACRAIGSAPYRGSRQEQIGPNVRCVGFERRASILFVIEQDRVVILSVMYGGQSSDPDLIH